MRFNTIVIAMALGLAPPPVVAAVDAFPPDETRRLVYDYAKCVVGAHAAIVAEVLLNDVDNASLLKRYGGLVDADCLERYTPADAMSFSGDLYRYALADALVARELAKLPPPDLSKVPPLTHRQAPSAPQPLASHSTQDEKRRYDAALKASDEAQVFRAVSVFGECVVRADAANAKALLLTRPTSLAETRAFEALRPAFSDCLPVGQTLTFGKVMLRGTVAVNYYRLARAVSLPDR